MKMAHFYILLISTIAITNSTFASTVLDRADIPEVFQREYIYTSAAKHTFVQTYGVATCVALIMHNSEGETVLAHLDSGTKVGQAISNFVKNLGDVTSVRLYGGQPPYRLEDRIVSELSKYKLNPEVIIRNDRNESLNLMLNLKSGDVEEYDETYASTDYRMANEKVKRLKFSSRISRHEESIGGGDVIEIDPPISGFDFNMFLLP
ncbi:hypothetical protein ABMA79_14385 [Halobacteriovorax sp. HFRX-2_2]|uniref:hypothetical protein n=1 Tax=unclassified Halobacteriovorax TaxID=2639665 RepID=UPI003714A129